MDDLKNVGESSCNPGVGADQRVQFLMFMMMMMMICMYMCVYLRTYVCMYERMYERTYVYMYVCMYVCVYVCMSAVQTVTPSCLYVCLQYSHTVLSTQHYRLSAVQSHRPAHTTLPSNKLHNSTL